MTPREIELHVGHYGDGTGARGYVDEVQYARKFIKRIYDILRAHNVPATYFEDTVSKSQRANINALVRHHNADKDGLIVSGHLNATAPKTDRPIGFEVLYSTQKTLAQTLANEVCKVSGLKNRGAKYRNDVGVLTQTYEPVVLLEFGFVNSSTDVAIMDDKFEDICFTIARVLAAHIGHTIKKGTTHASKRPTQAEIDAKIGVNAVDGANVYRLQSGRYNTLEDAQKALNTLLSVGAISYGSVLTFTDGYRIESGAYRGAGSATQAFKDARTVAENAIANGHLSYVTIVGYEE